MKAKVILYNIITINYISSTEYYAYTRGKRTKGGVMSEETAQLTIGVSGKPEESEQELQLVRGAFFDDLRDVTEQVKPVEIEQIPEGARPAFAIPIIVGILIKTGALGALASFIGKFLRRNQGRKLSLEYKGNKIEIDNHSFKEEKEILNRLQNLMNSR
jgi:hypothetical protein